MSEGEHSIYLKRVVTQEGENLVRLPRNLERMGEYHGIDLYVLNETRVDNARRFRKWAADQRVVSEPVTSLVLTRAEYDALCASLGWLPAPRPTSRGSGRDDC